MSTDVSVKVILCPTDFSPGAEPALAWASALSRTFGADLVILHVLDLSLGALAGMPAELAMVPAVEQLATRVRAEASESMSALARRFARARTLLREGKPRAAILQVADEVQADMIVMGTHGRTGLSHVFFGSVAEHVVRHSQIPVLTVRQQEEPDR